MTDFVVRPGGVRRMESTWFRLFDLRRGGPCVRRSPYFRTVVAIARALGTSRESFATCEDMQAEVRPAKPSTRSTSTKPAAAEKAKRKPKKGA
jgi:hypothetical protein